LLERFKKLKHWFHEFRQRVIPLLDHHGGVVDKHNIWPKIVEVDTALSFDKFSLLANEDVKARLYRIWHAVDAIWLELDFALKATASQQNEHTLSQLTQEELKNLADAADDEPIEYGAVRTYPEDAIEIMVSLIGLLDIAERCVSESRYMIAGRFDPREGPGKPISGRGYRLSALLLGFAAAMLSPNKKKLKFSRGKNRPPHSAADAVAKALNQCTDVTDPAARAILDEAPKTYDAIVRRLIPKCQDDEYFIKDIQLGQTLGRRRSKSDIIQSGEEEG
jgi:hypothetical protein